MSFLTFATNRSSGVDGLLPYFTATAQLFADTLWPTQATEEPDDSCSASASCSLHATEMPSSADATATPLADESLSSSQTPPVLAASTVIAFRFHGVSPFSTGRRL